MRKNTGGGGKKKTATKKKATLTRTVKKVDSVKSRNKGTTIKPKISPSAVKRTKKAVTKSKVSSLLGSLDKTYGTKSKSKLSAAQRAKKKRAISSYVNANKSSRR